MHNLNEPSGMEREVNKIRSQYSLADLEALPTLSTGQADDLKLDDGELRFWLSRCGVEDGEPYPNKVTVEQLIDGQWVEVETYQAED